MTAKSVRSPAPAPSVQETKMVVEHLLAVMDAMLAAPGASGWFARQNGEPAGGATMIIHDRLAQFAGDATVPECRQRGVQTALIHARLAEAARQGCDLAVVCTKPGTPSQRNYERAGFRLIYARILMVREPKSAVSAPAP